MHEGPLSNLIVADFSQLVQGPAATQIMGDLGAQVLKIEPTHGDWLRHFALGECFSNGESVSFLAFNRNKRSIAIDLKTPEGHRTALDIVSTADILVENFRPGVMARLGLDYDSLKSSNPRLIYCSGSGYGRSGPHVDRPGQDLLAQATSGWAWLNGRAGEPPAATAVGIADLTAANHLVIGALTALHDRHRTGRGQRVDVSLLRSILHLQAQELAVFLSGGPAPDQARSDSGIPNPYSGAPYGIYQTSDGWIAVAMTSVGALARITGVDDLVGIESNNVMAGRDEIRRRFLDAIARRTTSQWMELFSGEDIWAAEVQRYDSVVEDPQVKHSNLIETIGNPAGGELSVVGPPLELSEHPTDIRHRPPRLGEHSREILSEVGYTSDRIHELFTSGAVA